MCESMPKSTFVVPFVGRGHKYEMCVHSNGQVTLKLANESVARTLMIIDPGSRIVMNTPHSVTLFCARGDKNYRGCKEWKIDDDGGFSLLFAFDNAYCATFFVKLCEGIRYYAGDLSEKPWSTAEEMLTCYQFDVLQVINHQRNGKGLIKDKTVPRDVMCLICMYLNIFNKVDM